MSPEPRRSPEAERVAVDRVLRLAAETGARVTIAHASQVSVVDRVAEARQRGADLVAETCPQYLTLFEDEVEREGALRKFTPQRELGQSRTSMRCGPRSRMAGSA